jgi:hypothetical protein
MDLAKNLYYLALLMLLCVGSGVQVAIGYYGDGKLFMINPTIYPLLASFFMKVLLEGFGSFNKEAYLFGAFGVIILTGKLVTGVEGYSSVVNYVFIPFMFCLMFPKKDIYFRDKCYKTLLYFFVANSLLAIIERLLLVKLFPVEYDQEGSIDYDIIGRISYDSVYFRSNALMGSPLTNSLCLTAILVFILMIKNEILNYQRKLLLFMVGMVAIVCFNTRTSMILWPILFVVATVYSSYQERSGLAFFSRIAIIIISAMLLIVTVLFYNIGDRLFRLDLMDHSANVRLDVIEMLLSMNITEVFFSFGMKGMDVRNTMYNSGVKIIENPWILYFCQIGGIGLIMVVMGYYKIFSKIVRGYSKFITSFIFLSFLLLGSTNNGLKETAMSVFVVCCYAMPVYNNGSPILKKEKKIS